MSEIEIIEYERSYQPEFRRLNLYWLDKYNLTETHDLEILDNPEEKVINDGGCIFLAMDGSQVVGTCGIARVKEDVYELVKMVVDPGWHGRGIGKRLLERCLDEAKNKNARKVLLFSNSQLITALKMYEKHGFRYVPVTDSLLLTADVKMELNL